MHKSIPVIPFSLQSLEMKKFTYQLGRKLQQNFLPLYNKVGSLLRIIVYLYRFLLFRVNPFFIHLGYHITLSLLGYLSLKLTKPRSFPTRLNDLDLFFISVSASTFSGLSVLVMEVFSNKQLIIITILMLLGGDIFTSMLGLVFTWLKLTKGSGSNPSSKTLEDPIEVGIIPISNYDESQNLNDQVISITSIQKGNNINTQNDMKQNSIRYLAYVVLGYLLISHLVGCIVVFLYLSLEPRAKEILKNKGLNLHTCSVFIVVSSLANCGLIPTNERVMVLKKNAGFLMLLIPLILLGNTFYPPCLRLVIWALEKLTKREEFFYLLKNHKDMGYDHLFSSIRCYNLAMTVVGLLATQFVMFCALELNSKNMEGLSSYQKLVASFFQVVNSRHAGESAFDLSTISSAMLVLFVVMMYLPPYTTFSFIKKDKDNNKNDKNSINREKRLVGSLLMSQISYVAIFVILICITEKDKLERDPFNFNLLSIIVEVISAYGSVGWSTGYSCKRKLKSDGNCKERLTSLSGRFSYKGKVVLILVIFFGKFKKFNENGGKGWALF